MKKDIKSIIKETLKVLDGVDCPKELREICFEVLLTHYLSSTNGEFHPVKPKPVAELDPKEGKGRDIAPRDLHLKANHFLKQEKITIKDINQIFYKEDEGFEPLYDDLGTTQLSESQIRLALLEALKNAMKDGNFEFDTETVREECRNRKCYDGGNFSVHFKNKKELFAGFDKRKKEKKEPIKLSGKGKSALAELIKKLSE